MSGLRDEQLLIVGCGGHSKVVTDVAESIGFSDIIYLNTLATSCEFIGRPVLHQFPVGYCGLFHVAVGDNQIRECITMQFIAGNPQSRNLTLIHPSSVISASAGIGKGVLIMPLCIVNSCAQVGDGVILNSRASVDHDNILGSYSSLAPGVTLGGGVSIGERSAISIGSTVKNGITIGKDVVIGAGSLVMGDFGDNILAYGIPSRHIRYRKRGEYYL